MYLRYEINSDGVFIPIEGIFENGDILKFDFSKFDIEIEDGKPKRYGRVNDENGREWVTILEAHPLDIEIQLISLSELVSRRNELQTTKQKENNGDESIKNEEEREDVSGVSAENNGDESSKKDEEREDVSGVSAENNGDSIGTYLLALAGLVVGIVLVVLKKGKKGKDINGNSLEDGGIDRRVENKWLLNIFDKVRKGEAEIAGLGATSVPNISKGKSIGWALALFYRLAGKQNLIIGSSSSLDKAEIAKEWLIEQRGEKIAGDIEIMMNDAAVKDADIVAVGVPEQYILSTLLKLKRAGMINKVLWVFGVPMNAEEDVRETARRKAKVKEGKKVKIVELKSYKNLSLCVKEYFEVYIEDLRRSGVSEEEIEAIIKELRTNHYENCKCSDSMGEIINIIMEGTGNVVVNAGNNVPAFKMGKEGALAYEVEVCTNNPIAGQIVSLLLKQVDENLQPIIYSLSNSYGMESKTPWYAMYPVLLKLNPKQYENLMSIVEEINNRRLEGDITYDEAREEIKAVVINAKIEENETQSLRIIDLPVDRNDINDGGDNNDDLLKMLVGKVEKLEEQSQKFEQQSQELKQENQELTERLGHVEKATEVVDTLRELSRSAKDPIIEKIIYCNLKKMIKSDGRKNFVKKYDNIVHAAEKVWIELGGYNKKDSDLSNELLKKVNTLCLETMNSKFNCFLDLLPRQLIADEAFKKAEKAGKVIERKTKSGFEAAIVELKTVINAFNETAGFRDIADRAFSYKMSLTEKNIRSLPKGSILVVKSKQNNGKYYHALQYQRFEDGRLIAVHSDPEDSIQEEVSVNLKDILTDK
ncbi:MAG: hypothetical protein KAJ14_01630, partial [Candidatus Omnitrophica bacterium]|nr:hypothetical protein [Candidatus Omnitrophota bacterium]